MENTDNAGKDNLPRDARGNISIDSLLEGDKPSSSRAAESEEKKKKKAESEKKDEARRKLLSESEKKHYDELKKRYTEDYGFDDSPTLRNFLFLSADNFRLEREIMRRKKKEGTTDKYLMKEFKDNASKIASLEESLAKAQESRKKAEDVANIHERTLKECEDYVKDNIGEFAFYCKKCNSLIDTMGLPHWALQAQSAKTTTGEAMALIWSKELWNLYKRDKIELWEMAYVLRTSVEGVVYCARLRDEEVDVPENVMLEQEAKLRDMRKETKEI